MSDEDERLALPFRHDNAPGFSPAERAAMNHEYVVEFARALQAHVLATRQPLDRGGTVWCQLSRQVETAVLSRHGGA